MSERWLLAVVVLLVALVTGLGLFWNPDLPERPLPVASVPVGGDFTLQSADGPVALADFRGKAVLLFFGYTYCPDVCPTALSTVATGLNQLSAEELADVAVLFVSVDPKRDTPARLKEYAAFFHPAIVGVTGSPEAVAEVARRYGVFYAEQQVATAGDGYVVDHSADTYVIGRDGRLLGSLPHGTGPEQVAAEIRKILHTH
ncbi:SCO family protein [Azonexus sp.]|jgi:protein SCO1/2|uniref:SCO family protein n=1 Tax=Azonexus sp. TaxID=1872668 RepID=UPI0028393220|nr:SCO family protein [Azonexus sp.]MDR1994402.1 SCO family protein [Azonexus sp.]